MVSRLKLLTFSNPNCFASAAAMIGIASGVFATTALFGFWAVLEKSVHFFMAFWADQDV